MTSPSSDAFVVEADTLIFPERTGNAIHLSTVVRKFTNARPTHGGAQSVVKVNAQQLYDALGLFRALRYDLELYNEAMQRPLPDAAVDGEAARSHASYVRLRSYRLLQQASAFGVRLGGVNDTGPVVVLGLEALIAHLEARYADEIGYARKLIQEGTVDFASLAELFTPGREFVDHGVGTGLYGVPAGSICRACYYTRTKTLFGEGSTFYAALEFVVSIGSQFAVVEHTHLVGPFTAQRPITSGPDYCALQQALKQKLEERGRVYERGASAPTLMAHTAAAFIPISPPGAAIQPQPRAVAGRVMLDTQAALVRGIHVGRLPGSASEAVAAVLKAIAHRARGGAQPSELGEAAPDELGLLLVSAPLPSELLWRTWPLVAGFSFAAKRWGLAVVDGLSEVRFNSRAFSQLVLPEERKRLIEALVLHSGASTAGGGSIRGTADLIENKGEGAVFLLHGPPGVGKTLTAEAISELLGKPLYSVSMGELGTTPEALERALQEVFALCAPWGALVLIDEAEMLLEKRSKDALVRNAMVCVMLRLVEYYSGVLFLTSNHVSSIDPAFQSRVQCALQYESLGANARAQIWTNLLAAAGADPSALQVERLARFEMNGRQIKNALQLAIALSRRDNVALNQSHLDQTVSMTLDFATHSDTFDEHTAGAARAGEDTTRVPLVAQPRLAMQQPTSPDQPAGEQQQRSGRNQDKVASYYYGRDSAGASAVVLSSPACVCQCTIC